MILRTRQIPRRSAHLDGPHFDQLVVGAAAFDEAHGAGLGYVTVFNGSGRILRRLQHVAQLNAPWGVAKAPSEAKKK